MAGGESNNHASRPKRSLIMTLILAGVLGGLIGGSVVYAITSHVFTPPRILIPENGPLIPVDVDINTAITDAVAHVGPAVVTVINTLPPRTSIFGGIIEQVSSGSGVIISSDGYIVTNHHVVEGTESLKIILADGSTLPASLVGIDQYADLAVLEVPGEMPAVASWGNSDTLKPGETVIAIGSPLGDFKNTVTVGVVSAMERSIEVDNNFQLEGLIQTDAAINQGNSGGPLVNLAGQVVGINTLVIRGSDRGGTVAEGLGFASPSNTAIAIVAQLIDKGYVSRPYLGIRYVPISPALAKQFRLPVTYGIYLSDVVPGGPAHQAGLRQGEILISIDDKTIDIENPFINRLLQYEPGDVVTFQVVKDDQEIDLQITLGEQPAP
jgi:serine protease Do